ncbi:MAG: hypothetical protein WKG01_02065 [Kofleriaceae bacterium]
MRTTPFTAGLLAIASLAGCQQDEREDPVSITSQEARRALLVPSVRGAAAPKRVWADHTANAIKSSELDGSAPDVLFDDVQGPYGLSLDVAAQRLVFTSSELEVVQIAPVGGGEVASLETSFEEGYAILHDIGTHKVVYGLRDTQIIKLTEDIDFGTEAIEVLLQVGSPDEVHGLALTPDGAALYVGDSVGQMSQKLNLATHVVEPLYYAGPAGEPDPIDPGTQVLR